MSDRRPTRLTLVGTLHRAPRGRDRLASLLGELQPDVLTLEVSPYAIAFRRRRGPLLLVRLAALLDRLAAETNRPRVELAAHPEVSGIRALLELPFEYQAASAHAAAANIPLELLDSSLVSARKLRRVDRALLTWKNLAVLVTLPTTGATENMTLARKLVWETSDAPLRQAFLEPRRGPEGIGPRDRRMAQKIRRHLENSRGGHLVHVGGWLHLVEDERGETLYSLLRDWRPRRILL